jgi:hypothetical protein
LDPEAAKKALCRFLGGSESRRLDHVEFVNMIVDHLTDRGVMEPRLSVRAPFGLRASSWPLHSTASGDAARAHPLSVPVGRPGIYVDDGSSWLDTGRTP